MSTVNNVRIENVFSDVNFNQSNKYNVGSAINELLSNLTHRQPQTMQKRRTPPADVIVKIKHNHLNKKQHIIRQYLDYSSLIEEAYDDIDKSIPFGKDTILRNLENSYFKALDNFEIEYFIKEELDLEVLREKSGAIIDFIISDLKKTIYESNNTPELQEHIDIGVNVVVAHAFIECVIMEKPDDT
ncbi:ABC-three component system protein [Halodesulfovibrio aestuarii]|uniref:Uncharacterized protein n=1 Tax=Halodesulfovibrio aestuarii TaxID=126333 RepID=A0A8G2CCB0_9BACT|nr:ABC-three component system protein [Halodesulfovibrio aestuarii]SHJ76111.1 hypothetical protein SAMN05660830_03162 [Halodesulfovibrio aestuarii]